ncbi:MAG TPA: HAD family phosphatase [Rubrivivax sp.]
MSGAAGLKRAVVFDFGAVLFQWKPVQLLRQSVPELAGDDASARALAAKIFESFTPESDWARFDTGKLDEDALAKLIAQRIGASETQVRRVIDAIPPHLVAQAPMVALFRQLKAVGHSMYFLSNMPLKYATRLERENPFIAEFEDGIFSGRVGLMKPQAAIFELARQRFGIEPARTVFIDDHAGNVAAAQALGWQGIRFEDAAQCTQALQAGGWIGSALPGHDTTLGGRASPASP